MQEMTRIAEHEMHAVVLSCKRARRDMLASLPAGKPCTNTAAQANLASLYLLGRGVPQNIPEGVRFARMAAAQGVVRAQIALGILYHAVGPGSGRVSSALIMQTWE
jgi:TPR repeat protein